MLSDRTLDYDAIGDECEGTWHCNPIDSRRRESNFLSIYLGVLGHGSCVRINTNELLE